MLLICGDHRRLAQDVGFPNWFALETLHSETYLKGLDSKEHALKSTGLFPCLGALGLTESNTGLSQGALLGERGASSG